MKIADFDRRNILGDLFRLLKVWPLCKVLPIGIFFLSKLIHHHRTEGAMISRINFGFFSLFASIALISIVGCANMKYTVHIDQSLEGKKITTSTIVVFPVQDMNYQPPSSCMGPSGSPGNQMTYQAHWNEKIRTTLSVKFPAQKWVFISDGQAEGVDVDAVIELSKNSLLATTINEMSADQIMYEPLREYSQIQTYLQNLVSTSGAQYAMVFVNPMLSGEVQTTYSPGFYNAGTGTMTGGGMSSTTYYTADIQALVWECATGKLLFSSGGWSHKSSPCFFIPPQDIAIDGANGKFQKNLAKIITLLMDYDASKRVTTR
jgi:hypothetical protein